MGCLYGDTPTEYHLQNDHRSNAETLINSTDVIYVHGNKAMCDGGGGALGHPIEFIQLKHGEPSECKYCGLMYQIHPDYHGHGH